jgi:hypothetical protein
MNHKHRLTLSDAATPFGCCDFFDRCGDEIMSLHYGGQLGILDWMGFGVSDVCYRTVQFINYVRPTYAEGEPTPGYISDPCADPNPYEFGSCKLTVEDFGRLGRSGPVRDIMKPKLYCQNDPRWRLDGTPVTDEDEWDMRFAMDVMINDLMQLIVTGNAATGGQFDGLQRWVRTGYDCSMLNSIVIDWNDNNMNGGAGITWNGNPVAATFDFVDVLLAAYRRIRTRITWNPALRVQPLRIGDIILVMPQFMAHCLLDFYTCWSVCAGRQYNEANLQTFEARTFRNNLIADSPENLFGNGFIRLDGFPVPILVHDWEMINGPTRGDVYMLTGRVGGMGIWEGEHLSAETAAAEYGSLGYFSTDGGRVLGLWNNDNECKQMKIWMHPRLFCKAPWAQIRFQDVACVQPGGPLSPDPTENSYYPEDSFVPAECPE